jgi:hypothetical protein
MPSHAFLSWGYPPQSHHGLRSNPLHLRVIDTFRSKDNAIYLHIYKPVYKGYQLARQIISPPSLFLAASWISTNVPSSNRTNITSPNLNGWTVRNWRPETIPEISFATAKILLFGWLTRCICFNTGLKLWYFNPTHNRLDDTLSYVVGVYSLSGPWRSPRWTDDKKPSLYSPSATCKCNLVIGTDVKGRLTLLTFWRCEQKCAKLTNDIIANKLSVRTKTSRNQPCPAVLTKLRQTFWLQPNMVIYPNLDIFKTDIG